MTKKLSAFRKIAGILGIAVFCMLLLGILAFGLFYNRERTVIKTVCKPYLDSIIVNFIDTNWDVAIITSDTSAAKQDTSELTKGFRNQLRPLGKLTHYDGGNGYVQLGLGILQFSESIFYDAHATFQHGEADLHLKLKRTQSACEVTEINITPSVK